jgi:mycothiol system anti-sigma-R factor
MNCDDSVERIYQYLDGEINWYRRARIRYHLRNCTNCTGAFSFEERLKIIVRRHTNEEPPVEFMNRLRSFMDENR